MRTILSCCCSTLLLAMPSTLHAADWTLQLELRGQEVVGTPVEWTNSHVLLLGRDGHLWDFAPSEVGNFQKVSDSFRPLSGAEMRLALQNELGRKLEVTNTGHFVVAHPRGERTIWAERFDQLYRSFTHYFTARGLRPQTPRLPLVAIVFDNRTDYVRYSASVGERIPAGVIGHYSITTNRIAMYDLTAATGNEELWYLNAETIIHEAAHQAAFNSGLHNRYAPPPRWVIEGLGTMFEAPGVWDSRAHPRREERINAYRLEAYRREMAKGRPADRLAQLVSSDRLFQTNPEAAYAEAWALTFYLAENDQRGYARLLRKTADLTVFETYDSPHRLKDFTDLFGTNLSMLDTRIQRFIETLPSH